jgi:hypothetical protein
MTDLAEPHATPAPGALTADGVLVVYHRFGAPWIKDASTVREHLHSFSHHSRHRIWEVNVDFGLPAGLSGLDFRAIILHYSVFGMGPYRLDDEWLAYLDQSEAYKIAFFQDEYTRCQPRFKFLNDHRIDCVYTCLEPSEFDKVYGRYTGVPTLVSNLPGYVSGAILEAGRRFSVPLGRRTVDVGYRGRPLPPFMGRGAMEKHGIGVRFGELARDSGLLLDLATGEGDRLYGNAWYEFMANCRCVLGVESGVSAFDLEDEVLDEYNQRLGEGLSVDVDDLRTLPRWEDVVYYRTASPRHFEAAALRVCQVLFEGRYSGVMEPMVHYIPLKKDFSNIDEVVAMIRDDDLLREISENAHRDLIASGAWSYARLMKGLDEMLDTVIPQQPSPHVRASVDRRLAIGRTRQRWRRVAALAVLAFLGRPYPQAVIQFVHPVTKRVRRILGIPGPAPTS